MKTHGYSTTAEGVRIDYRCWINMVSRCYDRSSSGYATYGGKGIRVAKRWRKFENFLADLGPRPTPQHSIDRINNAGKLYGPGLCRWATEEEQQNNKSDNVRVVLLFAGKVQDRTLAQWQRLIPLHAMTYQNRRWQGLTPVQALTTPVRGRPDLVMPQPVPGEGSK